MSLGTTSTGSEGASAAWPVPSGHRLASRRDWSLTEYVCTAGPDDAPFEEAREGFTIAAVVAGTFRYRADTGEAILHPGAVLLGNHATCYACGHAHSRGDRCIAISIAPRLFAEIAASSGGTARYRFASPMLPARPVVQAGFSALLQSLAHRDPIEIETRIVHLIEQAVTTASGITMAPQEISRQDEKRITRALRRIEREFAEPLDLDTLAATAGMSKYHFLRTFRRVAGQPPHQYLLGLRLAQVAHRLSSSATPIADLALDAGFGDLSTFNSRFKRHFGESPSAWRRRTSR